MSDRNVLNHHRRWSQPPIIAKQNMFLNWLPICLFLFNVWVYMCFFSFFCCSATFLRFLSQRTVKMCDNNDDAQWIYRHGHHLNNICCGQNWSLFYDLVSIIMRWCIDVYICLFVILQINRLKVDLFLPLASPFAFFLHLLPW